MKTCTKCNENKEFSYFGKAKLGKDGLRSICRKCHNTETTKRNRENPEKATAYGRKYRDEKKEKISLQRAVHTLENKERLSLYGAEYRKENPGKVNANTAKYKAAKIQATPPWLTEDHFKEMQAIYIEAVRLTKETGIPHEVDHIVPLRGKEVRGLHVPWNLQILTEEENRKKSRKLI